ncbi:MAG: diguanylate phosphodiesterase [Frankiales bacterium]|nr:diguanylate phosphodiesterase [Frankiales bacterium]
MAPDPVERDRLESLATYPLEPGTGFDRLVELAARACDAPEGFVSVVGADRLRFLATVGSDLTELPRSGTFSAWVVDHLAPLVVEDAQQDERFSAHPQVRGQRLRSYAGVPLVGRDGLALGALCVADTAARSFAPEQVRALETLGESVVNILELSRLVGSSSHGRRLRVALDQGELVPWFQPVVDLSNGRPRALEALLRWEHPQRGIVPPGEFLPDVASSGLSGPVGRSVLHASLRALADLRARADVPPLLLVAVNVSPSQLAAPDLASSVLADLEAHRLAPSNLALEITEAGVFDNPAVVVRTLTELREAGMRIALDDFGTGHAGLRHLLELPITAIKLDGSLVARCADPRAQAVMRSTLSMAADLGVSVIAEGVETPEQQELMLSLGCGLGQGHLFSPAVPESELPSLLSGLSSSAPDHRLHLAESLVTEGADVLQEALREEGPVVLLASVPHRVAVEQELAARGVAAALRPGYLATTALEDVPPGAVVWTDLASARWAAGDVVGAIELEDALTRLPAVVHCGHLPHSLRVHGTEQQTRRLKEQHGLRIAPLERGLSAEARTLIESMAATGASHHSISAALNAAGHPTPFGVRWHWKQIARVLE